MAMMMHVDIVSAEQELYSGQAEMLVAPAEMGDVGIYPRHAQMLTRLRAGEVRIKTRILLPCSFFAASQKSVEGATHSAERSDGSAGS